jgi:hypothetical protein
MSLENIAEVHVAEIVAEKQKKPALSGKYSKFLTFGFWLSSMFEDEDIKSQLYNKLHLYGTVGEQSELFEQFLADEKNIAKTVRKHIADHNKPPKPVKAKAARKGKAIVHQDELICQLIADANADPQVVVEKVDKEAAKAQEKADKEAAKAQEKADKEAAKAQEKADKEAAKPKAAKKGKMIAVEVVEAPAPVIKQEPVAEVAQELVVTEVAQEIEPGEVIELVAEVIEEPAPVIQQAPAKAEKATKAAKAPKAEKPVKAAKAEKPKAEAKSKKTKAVPVPAPVEEEEEEEIQTRLATIGDTEYLIDQDFNVYEVEEPHNHIGKYNEDTGAIEPCSP